MDLTNIRSIVFEKLGNYRSTYAWLYRDDFFYLWTNSNEQERLVVEKYALKGDILGIKRWMKNHRLTDISEWTQVDIIEKARGMKISHIYNKSKKELIEEIKRAQRGNDSGNQRDAGENALPNQQEQGK